LTKSQSVLSTKWLISIAIALAAFVTEPAISVADSQKPKVRLLETMTWYTEEYPPFNFKGADGVPSGMTIDILMAAFEKIDADLVAADITIAPWNRSYKYIQNRPGTALFSMTYTPERRKIMRFVGPSVPSNIAVIARTNRAASPPVTAALTNLRIGVVRDDIGDQLIREITTGSMKIQRKNSLKQLLYLLDAGRVDVIAYASDVFRHAVKKSGGDPAAYEEVMTLKEGQLGYAFHRDTDPEVLVPLQAAIDELRADGTIDRIVAKYRN